MNTRETLILKTLQLKQLNTTGSTFNGDFVDGLLASDPVRADEITKNVCARIPRELAIEMESIGDMLNLNKREIITMALIDFLDKAKATIYEFNAAPEGDI